MKKLIILSIFTLSFSAISPVFASEMNVSVDTAPAQESLPNVLPQSENVLNVLPASQDIESVVETVIQPTPVSIPEVLPPSLPSRSPLVHIPTLGNVAEITEEILPVTPPCPATCPNPHPVIVPSGDVKVIPCRDVVVPAIEADATIPQADRLVLPENPCPSITPIIQVTSTGGGGGSVILPINVLPVNAAMTEENTSVAPVQEVLGEKIVETTKTSSPSFPKTGAAPSVPRVPSTSSTPTNTSNALTIISFTNDRKQELVIA
jgi:hypothetical protein